MGLEPIVQKLMGSQEPMEAIPTEPLHHKRATLMLKNFPSIFCWHRHQRVAQRIELHRVKT